MRILRWWMINSRIGQRIKRIKAKSKHSVRTGVGPLSAKADARAGVAVV